jgi:hypothetical protein
MQMQKPQHKINKKNTTHNDSFENYEWNPNSSCDDDPLVENWRKHLREISAE